MKIGVYLTCQGKFFQRLAEFYGNKIEIIFRENYVIFDHELQFPEEWKDIDAFIYQPIYNPPSKYYSDENLLENFIAKRAIRIRLPYIMYTGLYPWFHRPPKPELKTAYGNSWIEDDVGAFIEGTKTVGDILHRDDQDIRSVHKMSLNLLRQKETESDVQGFADFIEDNLRTASLFWTPNHPRGELGYKLCSAAFRLLDLPPIPESVVPFLDDVLSPERTPVLPCVRRDLGIKRRDELVYFDGDRLPMTSEQYIERYIQIRKLLQY